MPSAPQLGFLATTSQGWSELKELTAESASASVSLDGQGLTISQVVSAAR